MADNFSWEKFCNILDLKLQDVAKKDDLGPIVAEIIELREENQKLRKNIAELASRLEQIDHKTRSANIIVNGINSKDITTAKTEFTQMCSNVLGVTANVVTVRKLPKDNKYLFSLESSFQAVTVLAAKKKVKDKKIFIQKDYTINEQNIRYNLRQLNRNISKHKKNLKVRMGEFCTYINDKKYSWSMNKVVAYSNADAEYLRNLFPDASCPVDVVVRDGYPADNN